MYKEENLINTEYIYNSINALNYDLPLSFFREILNKDKDKYLIYL